MKSWEVDFEMARRSGETGREISGPPKKSPFRGLIVFLPLLNRRAHARFPA